MAKSPSLRALSMRFGAWSPAAIATAMVIGCAGPATSPRSVPPPKASVAPAPATAENAAPGRVALNFNPDWKFIKADPTGAEQPGFDDHAWAAVSTPHTYNDVDTFDNWSTP